LDYLIELGHKEVNNLIKRARKEANGAFIPAAVGEKKKGDRGRLFFLIACVNGGEGEGILGRLQSRRGRGKGGKELAP